MKYVQYILIHIVRIPQKAPGVFHVWKLVNISHTQKCTRHHSWKFEVIILQPPRRILSVFISQIQMEILKSDISTSDPFARVPNIQNFDYNPLVTVGANCVYTSYCVIFLLLISHTEKSNLF